MWQDCKYITWPLFAADKRFLKMHKHQEKVLGVPVTSVAVQQIFSHGGIFMRLHRARMGNKVLSDLV